MKNFLLWAIVGMTMNVANAQITETATDAVKNMGLGWNLGNTLDANTGTSKDYTKAAYWGGQGLESETCWGQPKTSKELLTMMKNAGFGAIRVPVTWYNHMDADGNVNSQWMARVKETVDYVIDNGMYCILNVHHDTGASTTDFAHWIQADATNYTTNKTKFEKLWTQIATEFKDYDKYLVFEGYNEMLDAKSTWNAPQATTSYKALNNYAQSFVDAVRATGGNNETRNLIVNTYAAANNEAPVKNLNIPTDKAKNHIAVEVHAYPNFFTWSTPATLRTIAQVKADVDYIANNLNTNCLSKGIPAIIGEWGSYGVDNGAGKTDYDVRKGMFLEFCDYFVKKMKSNNIATFYWMGMTDGAYRTIPAFNQADLAECVAKAYHGSSFKGEYPTAQGATVVTAFEGSKALDWGNPINVDKASFDMVGYPATMTIEYKQTVATDPDIQFWYGDWSSKISVISEGITYAGDFNPNVVYKTEANTDHTTVFSFDEATFKQFLSRGFLIQGTGITVTKMTLTSTASAITSVHVDCTCLDAPAYNLFGRRVTNPKRSIYIKNGKKFIER